MAPKKPGDLESSMASQSMSSQKDGDCGTGGQELTLTMMHKVRLCAGLLSSEAIGVFSYLFILPTLQTLGTPTSMMTLPGVVSSSLGLTLVPLLGGLTDRGSNPQRRKTAFVVLAFCIACTGTALTLSGVLIRARNMAPSQRAAGNQSGGYPPSLDPLASQNLTAGVVAARSLPLMAPFHLFSPRSAPGPDSSTAVYTSRAADSFLLRPILDKLGEKGFGTPASDGPGPEGKEAVTGSTKIMTPPSSDGPAADYQTTPPSQVKTSAPYTPNTKATTNEPSAETADVGNNGSNTATVTPPPTSVRTERETETERGETETVSGQTAETTTGETETTSGVAETTTGETETTTGETETTSRETDTTSREGPETTSPGSEGSVMGLPVTAALAMAGFVLMDFGFDLTNSGVKAFVLTHSPPADHVSILITGVFMAALGGCITSVSGVIDMSDMLPDMDVFSGQVTVMLLTLLVVTIICCFCTLLSVPRPSATPTSIAIGPEDPLGGNEDIGFAVGGAEGVAPLTLQREGQENLILASTSAMEALLSTSCQVEQRLAGFSVSLGLSHLHHAPDHAPGHAHRDVRDTTRLLPRKRAESYRTWSQHSPVVAEGDGDGAGSCCSNVKLRLAVIWLSTFFAAAALFTYNITISDYLGKVVCGGNPEAEVGSVARALYDQGLRSASLCTLVLNMSYVFFSLVHSRLIALLGPKLEFSLITLGTMGMTVAMRMTGNIWVIYVASAMMGLTRATMYTVPFLLANSLSQQQDGSSPSASVGFIMAFITCALPCAYLFVSAVTGPLISATGDPSSPMLVAVVSFCLSAATSLCIVKAPESSARLPVS